ncbi:hypothetical protein FHG87_018275 [Trinorchestia longiramus]|nr:hypothetical protein FHG87_018275 [Trinorchestia longiramus]
MEGALHLKCLLTMAGPDVICVAKDQQAQEVLKRIESCASFPYKTVTVEDIFAANCVYANGTLLHRGAADFPHSAKVITSKLGHFKLRGLEFSELSKAGGHLSCCSILVSQPKHLRLMHPLSPYALSPHAPFPLTRPFPSRALFPRAPFPLARPFPSRALSPRAPFPLARPFPSRALSPRAPFPLARPFRSRALSPQ